MRPLRVNSLPFTHIGFCLKWVLPRPVFRWVICSNAVLPIKENPWTTVEGAVPSRPLSQSLSPPPLLGKDHIIFGTLALLTLPIIIAVIIMIIYLFAVASLRGGGKKLYKEYVSGCIESCWETTSWFNSRDHVGLVSVCIVFSLRWVFFFFLKKAQ